MNDDWYFYNTGKFNLYGNHVKHSDSWTIAKEFASWLRSSGWVEEERLFTNANIQDIKMISQSVRLGDLIAFASEGAIYHWTIVTKIDVAAGIVYCTYHTTDTVDGILKPGVSYYVFNIRDKN